MDPQEQDPDRQIFLEEYDESEDATPLSDYGILTEAQMRPLLRIQPQPYFKTTVSDEQFFRESYPEINHNDLHFSASEELLRRYIAWEGFGEHHIRVYDNWITEMAEKNVYSRVVDLQDGRFVYFRNLRINAPTYSRDGKNYPLTPQMAREQGVTYGCDWYVDLVMVQRRIGPNKAIIEEKKEERSNICIGTIPCMLKSLHCILRRKDARQLALLGEDPRDPGGYFIVSGVEKVVLLQEQLALNRMLMVETKGSPSIRLTPNTYRGTVLVELVLSKKASIKIKLPSMKGAKKKKKKSLEEELEASTPSKELGGKDEPKKKTVAKSINVLRIFRILGLSSLEHIRAFITLFIRPEWVEKCMIKLTRNMVDFSDGRIDSELIASKMDQGNADPATKQRIVEQLIETDVFPHVNDMIGPNRETPADRSYRIYYQKRYLLAIMTARFLEYLAGYRKLDDRDSWSNKRVEGAGRMMQQLFRNAWRKTLEQIKRDVGKSKTAITLDGVIRKIQNGIVTESFRDSFIEMKWGVKRGQTKENVAQTLFRESTIYTCSHLMTVDVNIFRRDRQQSIRMIQNNQWAFICPVSTPEGENVGLVKALSILATVSLERDDRPVIRTLIGDDQQKNWVSLFPGKPPLKGMTDLPYFRECPPDRVDRCLLNGKLLGWCNGPETYAYLLSLRRSDRLPPDMSLIFDREGSNKGWLYIDMSPSRPIRPVLIVENKELVLDTKQLRQRPLNEMFAKGAMEYLSPWEQEYAKIATTVEEIREREDLFRDAKATIDKAKFDLIKFQNGEAVTLNGTPQTEVSLLQNIDEAEKAYQLLEERNKEYTHCEIDPSVILGIAAALIPWPNHNQAPRNTYQVSMGKQALGVYHSNHANRFDGKTKLLAFPQRAMVETNMYSVLGLDRFPPGENCYTAFMALPFTEEDSFVVKKEFLDNGGFRMYRYFTRKATIKDSNGIREKLGKPPAQYLNDPGGRYKYIYEGVKDDPNNGLPMIGAPLRQGDCVIAKTQTIDETNRIRNESVLLRIGDQGVVDKVLVTTDNRVLTVTVKLRTMRVPQEGDKFAPRNAQKGTVGLVMSDLDMPVDENGLTPDFIVNPLCIPSRMTVSYLLELMASKAGAYKGEHTNGGAFRPFHMNDYRKILVQNQHDEYGYETMRSGTSGKKLETKINAGPVFMQALKHHAIDKVQARGTGAVKALTRQPAKGRSVGGGLRSLGLCRG